MAKSALDTELEAVVHAANQCDLTRAMQEALHYGYELAQATPEKGGTTQDLALYNEFLAEQHRKEATTIEEVRASLSKCQVLR